MKKLALFLLVVAGCAAASGYDSKQYEGRRADPPRDPDTRPLPEETRKTIPDPRKAPEKKPAPAPKSEEPSHTSPETPDASS